MVIQNLIETKQFFIDETKTNYYVVYEKFENRKALLKERFAEERNEGTEELIHIFYGNSKADSVRSLCSYPLNSGNELEDTLKAIQNEHKEIFK